MKPSTSQSQRSLLLPWGTYQQGTEGNTDIRQPRCQSESLGRQRCCQAKSRECQRYAQSLDQDAPLSPTEMFPSPCIVACSLPQWQKQATPKLTALPLNSTGSAMRQHSSGTCAILWPSMRMMRSWITTVSRRPRSRNPEEGPLPVQHRW